MESYESPVLIATYSIEEMRTEAGLCFCYGHYWHHR